ncbi:Hypothetical predicted protein [Paramuricea clavata]|uniref:Uncharacterized protein n=1 Tax=Paramuricea clavata TaxID=317549 RepID=A0A6S7I427_PARCT|nr:Hypothetical predicted protein [Paramuricea clavata]
MESLDDDEKEGIELAVFNMMDSFPDDEFLDYLERPEIEAIGESYKMFIQESSVKSKTFIFGAYIVSELSTNFAVQCQSDHGFPAISCDQTIEQTINCDSKTKGGLIGFSLNHAAIHRWLLAQSERAAITNKCKDMASADAINQGYHFIPLCQCILPISRKDLDRTKCTCYEKSVNDVMSTVSNMIDPFTEQAGLVSLASGIVLDDAIADRLLESETRGEEQFVEFARENLLSESPDVFVKLPRNMVTTFSLSK